MKRHISISMLVVLLSGCMGGLHRFSERKPIYVERAMDGKPLLNPPEKPKPKEIFGKQKKLHVEPLEDLSQETGSLTALDDERNYLFASYTPMNIGRYLDVKIVGAGVSTAPKDSPKNDKSKPKDPKEKSDKLNEEDELQQQLGKILPELQPPAGQKIPILTNMRMEIVHREKNGDVIVNYYRDSTSFEDKNNHIIKARLPVEVLREKNTFTTNDLVDVEYREENAKEIIERNSLTWNDEYALRLSGYREAKSQDALRMAEVKSELKNLGDKLQNKVSQLIKDKQTLAKERDQILVEKRKLKENPPQANAVVNQAVNPIPAKPLEQMEAPTALEKPVPPVESKAPIPPPEQQTQTALKLNDVKGD